VRGEAGLGEFDFELVVFIGALSWSCIKGDLVVGRHIGDTFLEQRSEIVVEFESETTALDGEHRKREIPGSDLVRLDDAFEEVFVVRGAEHGLGVAGGIYAVESDTRLAQLSGEAHDVGEDLLLLLGTKESRKNKFTVVA
jgi:hypothetical protein